MKTSVLSRWPDGSASVVVVSGLATVTANVTRSLEVQTTSGSTGVLLTPSRINQVLTGITLNF